jgi:hypothetical protein
MVNPRRGATKLGCLVSLLFVAALGYFGFPAGEKYSRYLQYQDAMQQEVKFSAQKPIPEIRARLRLIADSLGLPPDAGIVVVRKNGKQIFIDAHYDETFDLPGFKRDVHFAPKAQGNY